MRKRFEPQIEIGRLLIEDAPAPRSRDGMAALVTAFLHTSRLLSEKIKAGLREWPVVDVSDLSIVVLLESYHSLLNKHIDLVERRLLKGEKISERDQDRFLEF